MSDWELQEELQKNQQRFTAALKILELKMALGDGKDRLGAAVDESIEIADLLLATLDMTETQCPGRDISL